MAREDFLLISGLPIHLLYRSICHEKHCEFHLVLFEALFTKSLSVVVSWSVIHIYFFFIYQFQVLCVRSWIHLNLWCPRWKITSGFSFIHFKNPVVSIYLLKIVSFTQCLIWQLCHNLGKYSCANLYLDLNSIALFLCLLLCRHHTVFLTMVMIHKFKWCIIIFPFC